MTPSGRPVAVGVGRSAASRLAVAWAADEAARRHVPLRLVHVLEWPRGADPHPDVDHPEHTWSAHYRAGGEWLLGEVRNGVLERHPGLETQIRLADGTRGAVLREQGDEASLLVIGSRRIGVVDDLSVSGGLGVALCSHARCPVVVVRAPEHITHEPPLVVVGVDGSQNCRGAVALAFEEAALRGARLLAVEAREPIARPVTEARLERLEAQARAELSESTAGWRERYPDVEVRHDVLSGRPIQELLRASAHADCLVVGSRGLGGFRGLLLGSVSHGLLHHAPCPLIVVPYAMVAAG